MIRSRLRPQNRNSQGNLDALYALGCMVEKGMGGKDNWGVAQAIFRTMEHQIGDAVAKKDGEGIEWRRKLGKKFWIKDDRYYIDLADAGSKIGYMPSRTELIYMSDEMMRRAYAQSGNRVGEGGDFGYCNYIINLAAEPSKAGIAKAARISRALREERNGFDSWSRKELEKAEQGKDSWFYAAGKGMSAMERLDKFFLWLLKWKKQEFAPGRDHNAQFYHCPGRKEHWHLCAARKHRTVLPGLHQQRNPGIHCSRSHGGSRL